MDGNFDVVIIGTGLAESIAAAALSKTGFKVAHIDENSYYGGNEASISLDELVQWVDTVASSQNPKYTSVSRSARIPSQTRQYSICLSPSIITSIGPVISSLISSGVAKYGGFRLLERVGVYKSGTIKGVPGSKEDVFKDKHISLIDKRRLMRFLKFAAGEFENEKELEGTDNMSFADLLSNVFSLKDDLHSALVFALAFCSSPTEPAVPVLHRIRGYLRSVGRYGPSPFLVGHYGGTGEIAQGFCRASAVSGGVYILGRRITSITHSSLNYSSKNALSDDDKSTCRYSLTLDDFPDTLTSHVIISSATHLPPHLSHLTKLLGDSNPSSFSVVRGIVIIDQGIIFPPTNTPPPAEDVDEASASPDSAASPKAPAPLDAGVIVFPPSSVTGGSTTTAATILVTGEGTMSTPRGKWILYITLPLSTPPLESTSAEEILRPYLNATLSLQTESTPSTSAVQLNSPPSSSDRAPSSPSEDVSPRPLFTVFYIEHPDPASSLPVPENSSAHPHTYIVPTPLIPACPLPDLPNSAATSAEDVFWETVRKLQEAGVRPQRNQASDEEHLAEEYDEIESFWPPMQADEESGGED
ncbi:Rab proteins geranylgeranyltransferase component A [Termitomyces sp. T112]|nr:Rab proteins geranylgeranyltransferase component A [Termitomyces sp. T112]KAH0587022.1 hypothetical protein H2248_005841 [Termitomyces sp. 'cryptogamus']